MLQIRDRLADLAATLTSEEQEALAEVGCVLVERAAAFYQELLRILDFAACRWEHGIPPARWWWYLDVVSHLPALKDEALGMGHAAPGRM
jgi:hypothetical protein